MTVEELKDYVSCPTLYDKKHVNKEKPARDRSKSKFDGHSHIVYEASKAIHELTGFYFHRLMDDRQIRYETLYKKWENKWWKDYSGTDILEYIQPVSRANRVRVNTNFINHLPRFHKRFHKPFKPIAVDREILLPINDIVLTCKIEMAYRLSNGVVRIVKFVPYSIAPGSPEHDLDLVAQACAWMAHNDEDSVEIAYYCMLSPNEYDPFTISRVDKNLIPKLSRIVKAFKDKELIAPTVCKGCEYNCETLL